MLSNLVGVSVSCLLVIVNLLSFYCLNLVSTKQISIYWIIPIMILYSSQLLLFLWCIQNNSMATVNFIWTICSIIGITITSILIFREQLTTLQIISFSLGIICIILFLYSNPTTGIIIRDIKEIISDKE